MSFKDQLTKLRKRNNMNQTELANQIGVKQYVISSWETGRSEPSMKQLVKLSDIFNISTDYLIDKPSIIVDNEEDYNRVIKNIKIDLENDFINNVYEMCKELNADKKKKILNIIQASIDLSK